MDQTAAWDTYAKGRSTSRSTNAAGAQTWFNWTQYPDHGPGAELLGDPASAIDLGCGTGRNAAHLAVQGARMLGVDFSPVQFDTAVKRWGAVANLTFVRADAVDFLTEDAGPVEAITSVFGAVWFTAPDTLLPLVHQQLTPGGVFAFSHEPPIEGCYGCQGSYIRPKGGGRPHVVRRWAYTEDMWRSILARHGFTQISTRIIQAPDPDDIPTLLVRCVVPPTGRDLR